MRAGLPTSAIAQLGPLDRASGARKIRSMIARSSLFSATDETKDPSSRHRPGFRGENPGLPQPPAASATFVSFTKGSTFIRLECSQCGAAHHGTAGSPTTPRRRAREHLQPRRPLRGRPPRRTRGRDPAAPPALGAGGEARRGAEALGSRRKLLMPFPPEGPRSLTCAPPWRLSSRIASCSCKPPPSSSVGDLERVQTGLELRLVRLV